MNETAESLRARVHADHSFAWQRLTTWPVLGWLLRRGYLLLGLQVLSFALLVLAIVAGILQPDAPFGITLLLTWGIFWPLLTSVVTPTLGNAFCAVCPMGFAGKWLNKIGLRRRFPMRLRGVWLGLFTIMALYWVFPFVSLAALDLSTRNTALYFLGFVLCSFTLFYVYKDMAWCKQVCPLGRVLAAHGKVGVLAISTDQQACSTCKTFECAKACAYHLSPFRFDDRNNMGHCTLCTDCVTACDSAHLVVRPPGAALRKPILGSDRQEAWLFILILAVVGVGVQFQHFISHTPLAAYMPWTILGGKLQAWSGADPMYLNFAGMLILVCSLGLTISLSLWCYRGAARVAKRGWNETAGVLAVALAPLAIIGLLPHALTIFSTRDAHALVAEAGTLLGTAWQIEPLAAAGDPILQAISMLGFVGILWSLWLVWQRSVLLADTRMARLQIWAYGSLPVWFYTAILVSGVLSIAFMQGSAGGHAH